MEDPRDAVSGEASDASTSESVGAGQRMIEVGRRHGDFVVPGLVAVDAVGGSLKHREEVVGVLGLGGLTSGERDELQNGNEFEGGDG